MNDTESTLGTIWEGNSGGGGREMDAAGLALAVAAAGSGAGAVVELLEPVAAVRLCCCNKGDALSAAAATALLLSFPAAEPDTSCATAAATAWRPWLPVTLAADAL